MKSKNTNIRRAAKLLEDAFGIVIYLKATNNKPQTGDMIDSLETNVRKLNKIIRTELEKNSLEEAKLWDKLDIFLKISVDFCLGIILNIILRYKYFLLKQKLRIYLL
ncbi:MAG: hypothetical protein ACYDIA_04605 [Candidatus Humimicrobiaceae bacterium]